MRPYQPFGSLCAYLSDGESCGDKGEACAKDWKAQSIATPAEETSITKGSLDGASL